MNMPLRANVAQVVAKILARRATPPEEVPELMRTVEQALVRLAAPAAVEPEDDWRASMETVAQASAAPRQRRRRLAPEPPEPALEAARDTVAPTPAPALRRRAEVIAQSAPSEVAAPTLAPAGTMRGIVKWFDLRTRRGALRLPGVSSDVPVETAVLDEMTIPRLYKGQEVEATLAAGDPPRLVRLTLPGGAWQVSSVGGVVKSRHAKTVVVEMKREALRRVAARAEAEMLLGPGRAR